MPRKFKSKNIIPKISLWGIDEQTPFNAVLFDSIPPVDMPQYKVHQKNHFVLTYCIKGSFKSFIDFKEQVIKEGDAGLINPNQIHFIDPINKQSVKAITLAFSRAFCSKLTISARAKMLINASHENINVHGQVYHEDVIPLLFRSIVKEFEENNQQPTPTLVQLMSLLITRLCALTKPNKEMPKTNFLYYSFLKLLDERIKNTHRVSEYAEALATSEKTLNRACQSIAERTAQHIIHQKINFEAKRQLAFNETSAKELAYSLGFSGPIQFSKFFKQHNGMSPLEYRRKIRTDNLSG